MAGTDYHCVITLQWARGGTIHAVSVSTLYSASRRDTRADMYAAVLNAARHALDAPDHATVSFVSMEPNDL